MAASGNSQPSAGFQKALDSFMQDLTPSQKSQFKMTTSEDLKRSILDLQYTQSQKRGGMVNMRKIEGFIGAMEQFGKVVEVFANTSEIVAFVWGPMKFILQTAGSWAESLNAILDAYKSIAENLPIFQEYENTFAQNSAMQSVLERMWSVILQFHKEALKVLCKNTLKQIFRSVWDDFRSRFKPMLDELKSLKELVESHATQLHITQYNKDRVVILAALERTQQKDSCDAFTKARDWISAASQNGEFERHQRALEGVQNKTQKRGGQWILGHEKMKSWLGQGLRSSILWVSGIPGAGKSVLASVVIEKLKEIRKDEEEKSKKNGPPPSSHAFFFCKYKDTHRNRTLAILSALLDQILKMERDIVPYVNRKCDEQGDTKLESLKLCKEMLEVIVKDGPTKYLVVDGIDEYEDSDRKEFLDFILELIHQCDQQNPGSLRLVIFSREEPDIKKRLAGPHTIQIMPDDVGQDITNFVEFHSRCLQEKFQDFGLTEDSRVGIQNHVVDQADGMFLFAFLVMENLGAQENMEGLKQELDPKTFPKDLDSAYERTLKRIMKKATPNQGDVIRTILKLMTCCCRPLKWHEIQAAISIVLNDESERLDPDRCVTGQAQDLFGSLVLSEPAEGGGVEFVHKTAEDYMARSSKVTNITALSAEHRVTLLCLQYLTWACFDRDMDPHPEDPERQFAFQDYASAHWADHVGHLVRAAHNRLSGTKDTGLSDQDIKEMEKAAESFMIRFERELMDKEWPNCEYIQAATFLGLPEPVFTVIWRGVSWVQTRKEDEMDKIFPPTLQSAVLANREILESIADQVRGSKVLRAYYGDSLFKCSKRTCYHFHEGFASEPKRRYHHEKHEPWYGCPEISCPRSRAGFRNEKERAKHVRQMHPAGVKLSNSFPRLKKAPPRNPPELKHACSRSGCPARFSRPLDLRAHIRLHNLNSPDLPSLRPVDSGFSEASGATAGDMASDPMVVDQENESSGGCW
ncbi:hypothetical protein RB595_007830 [Gaeumannomyces hyphopodioides]